MKHNASIIGEYTGILLTHDQPVMLKGNFKFWMTLLAHSKMAHCKITSKQSNICFNTMTNWIIRASCNYKVYYMYTNVLIKNNKICSWAVA